MNTLNIDRVRGDSFPFAFTVKDATGTVVNITGATATLTINSEENPLNNDNRVAVLTGVITSGTGGTIEFRPTTGEMDILGTFYYDVQLTDASGYVRTLAKGTLTVTQDITK